MNAKKNNKVQNNVQNQQVNNNGCQHVQLGGVAQQMQDGTFDFVAVSKPKSQSELIKKLAHGRLSKTKDGAIQLTLKVFCHEGLNIAQTLAVESAEGADALVDYQLKR